MSKIIVGPEGRRDAPICFIGQAPGREELRQRRPFCGPAGHLLDEVLRGIGISRSDCYVTNVLKEHPSDGSVYNDEDIHNWISFDRGRVTTTSRFDACVKSLWEELDTVSSNVLVPCGNEALYALTGKMYITKRRGSILEARGRKCIPIIHPAAALREYMFYHYIRADMKRIKAEAESPHIELLERNLLVDPNLEDVKFWLTEVVPQWRKSAVDIEIINEEISCISFAVQADMAISIPFVEGGQHYWHPDQELQIWKWIADVMENTLIRKVGHNTIFDTSFMFRRYGIRACNLEDTMIKMSILFPDFPRGLDFLTSLYTREPYYKDEGKKWRGFGGDERAFRVYNAKDSAVCIEADARLDTELEKQRNTGACSVQSSLIEPLMYMQARGMKVDTLGLKKASEEAEIKIMMLKDELNALAGCELNPNSPKQLSTYFYQTKGYKPYVFKGSVTTNMNAMKRLARLGSKEASIINQVRKIIKLKGTYLDVKLSEDGRLRSAMNPGKTVSGRLASSDDIFGEGTNVQNLPMAFRKFVIADDNYAIYSIDISQGENRIVAYIAPEPIQIKAFEDGKDMHRLTASLVFGIPFEEVKDEPGSSPLGNGEQSERYWGKKLNHSLNYGMGYRKFALDFELPESEAKLLVERWHQVYPGIRQYHEWIRLQLSKDRTLRNPYGRSRLFLDRWGEDLFKAGYDYIPQSTIAYKINEQGILYIWRTPCMKPVDLLNQVHDSLVFQLPLSLPLLQQAQIISDLVSSLETPIEWKGGEIHLPVDVKVGYNLYDSDMEKVKIHGQTTEELARQLDGIYERIRVKRELPTVDWSLGDSSSIEEEVLD